jgi:uncharacterized protein YifN (PemK superfamily)
MALRHFPKIGEVLLCDFRGYEHPEMIKMRPVVVIAERLIGRSVNLVTIVPLSGQRSVEDFAYQVPIHLARPLSPKFGMTAVWAKCDMVAVVSRGRLDRFHNPPEHRSGPHRWLSGQITKQQIGAIKEGILHGLNLDIRGHKP